MSICLGKQSVHCACGIAETSIFLHFPWCIETDGDRFGWDGFATCDPSGNTANNNVLQALQCIDTDGDGFGWNGIATCDPSAR